MPYESLKGYEAEPNKKLPGEVRVSAEDEIDLELLAATASFINSVGKSLERRSPGQLAKVFEEHDISPGQIRETIRHINEGKQSPGSAEEVFSVLRFGKEDE